MPNDVREFGVDQLGPGVGLIVNDPHGGAVLLNDIALISPVHDETGRLLGFVANVAHHVDVGGGAPGSLAPARDLYQEGLVVPRCGWCGRGSLSPT